MNQLQLRWEVAPDRLNTDTLHLNVLLDGRSLIQLVREWEEKHCPEPKLAGSYLGLFDWETYELENWREYENDELTVLGCRCGTAECWPLRARMRTQQGRVIWDNFRQPHRETTWPYAGFGPFTFDAEQYRSEVHRALQEWLVERGS